MPTCLLEAPPSISLPGSSGNHPISAWTTSQVTRSRCYDHPTSTEGAFVHRTRWWTDLSLGEQMTGRSGQGGRCIGQHSLHPHCVFSVSHQCPQARGARVSIQHPGGSQPRWPSSLVSGSEAPAPIPLKAQSLLQTCPGSLTNAVSSARCPVVGGQDNKFCFVSKQMRGGGPLRGPQYVPWGGQLSRAALSSSRPRVSLRAPGRSGTHMTSQPCWAGSEVSKSGPQNCSSIQVQGSQPLRTKSTLDWTTLASPPGPGSSKYPQVDTFLPLDG